MRAIPVREAIRSLKSKGFIEKTRSYSGKGARDHRFFYFYRDGVLTRYWTKFSYKWKEVPKDLLGYMARQLGLCSAKQAAELFRCPIDKEKYIKKLELCKEYQE